VEWFGSGRAALGCFGFGGLSGVAAVSAECWIRAIIN